MQYSYKQLKQIVILKACRLQIISNKVKTAISKSQTMKNMANSKKKEIEEKPIMSLQQ